MEYIYPILIFIAMGILFGVLLVIVSKVFAVKVDERAAEITEKLPGANCGACGYAGCADYADATHERLRAGRCRRSLCHRRDHGRFRHGGRACRSRAALQRHL